MFYVLYITGDVKDGMRCGVRGMGKKKTSRPARWRTKWGNPALREQQDNVLQAKGSQGVTETKRRRDEEMRRCISG